ncbi:hypothetical protein [Chamaesiphon sp. OTE_20_metabat_361]|uniref:hypothetical protein n=1 Tax=Chamaesiphon sp. OTE_20_metabat_361 TaxID=2964689 RepID=UPI00286D616E|nr:hypothetical protein [Chamaesiphon sp. OTE_20_metabat_361]
MSNQNPAVPQPPQGGDAFKQNRDILAKVNAHADRSMDRLFADIDELLGDDPTHGSNSAPTQHNSYANEQYPQLQQQVYPPQRALGAAADTPAQPVAKAKRPMPLWLKAFLGLGVTAIAAGGVLTWLVNERKVVLPEIDTSWLPFQSQQVAPQDAKFADYMRKSIAKIDATAQTATLATNNIPTPATSIVATPATAPTAPVATAPTKTIVTAAPVAPTPVKPAIALVKTLPKGNRPGAIFEIDRQSKTVNVGQPIGKSNWSLVSVNKGEVIIKRKGGEIRSIDVGQKF